MAFLALVPCSANPENAIAAKARAIMAENCFDCHGPDKGQRKAGLRLDVREGALADLGGYQSVAPGKPDQSELIARLRTEDKDELMPPPKTGKALSQREIEILRKWIQQGADYPLHWSYRPVLPPAIPLLKNKAVAQNPIDHFVFAKLESLNLKPSPEACLLYTSPSPRD